MAELNVAVLVSGRGSNLQALIEACAGDARAGDAFPARIVRVVSNVPGAHGLERARVAGIPTSVVDHHDFPDRESFDEALNQVLVAAGADLVCLAGFMRVLGKGFVERWRDRLINIHPSLLPAFKGLHTHERVIEAGEPVSGCTVHFVRPDMDAGPIIVQAEVAVLPGDDAGALAARVLEQEHQIYPRVVRLIAEGRVRVIGERVEIDGEGGALNP